MTSADFAEIVEWLYTTPTEPFVLSRAADDLRIEQRTLRAMMHGRRPVAPTVASVVVKLAAAKSELSGWWDPPLASLTLSPSTRQELMVAHAKV